MTNLPLPLSEQIHARLTERLQPTALKVIDESAAHAGHVGANDSGQGTHACVRCFTFVYKLEPRSAPSPCV